MEGRKDLSAARRKLEEYKLSKGQGRTGDGGSEVNDSRKLSTCSEGSQASSGSRMIVNNEKPQALPPLSQLYPPPPKQDVPSYLNNMAQDLMGQGQGQYPADTKVLNIGANGNGYPTSQEEEVSVISTVPWSSSEEQNLSTPTAFDSTTPQNQGGGIYDRQYYVPTTTQPAVFFQSTPISYGQQQQPGSFHHEQEFYYDNPRPSAPLFYNVEANSASAMQLPPLNPHEEGTIVNNSSEQNLESLTPIVLNPVTESTSKTNEDTVPPTPPLARNTSSSPSSERFSTLSVDVDSFDTSNHGSSPPNSAKSVHFNIPYEHQSPVSNEDRTHVQRKAPAATLRRVSASSQEEKEMLELQTLQRMKSVQDALELQLEELRRDNERLHHRQSELVSQLEDNEKNIQELRKERDRSKEDAKKLMQPLNAKINNLYEENQRILKNSNDVGMELRTKLQAKTKQYEDMEQAFIIVSNSKMELAAQLDQEREKLKEMETQMTAKDNEIVQFRETVKQQEEILKSEQQKDAIIHRLEGQIHQYQVQEDTVQRALRIANNKINRLTLTMAGGETVNDELQEGVDHHYHAHHHGDSCNHEHLEEAQESSSLPHHEHQHQPHDDHNNCDEHNHDHQHHHDHDHHPHVGHDHHSHDEHDHHSHDGHEHHDHHHDHGVIPTENGNEKLSPTSHPPRNELAEMKKRLHHLEWENSTFRSDVEKLAEEARAKRQLEEKYAKLSEECNLLRTECQRFEMLVVQLQGENDTIGDYITLYQTQRLALKKSATEKDQELALLAKERESLLHKLEELSSLVRILRPLSEKEGEIESPNPHHHNHECNHSPAQTVAPGQNAEIEEKIRNLLTDINSSSLIENYHPCAVCSGRLMNV